MRKIAHFIIHSKAATYIAALLYVAMWLIHSLQVGGITLRGVGALLLTLFMGSLSVKVSREFSFNDVKNTLPATLFLLGSAITPQVGQAQGGGWHYLLVAVSCYILLRTYRDRAAMGSYFLAFVLVGTQCVFAPSLLFTLPLLVLCGASMESLHTRTFFAALWGLLCPFWMVAGTLFLTDRVELITTYLGRLPIEAFSLSALTGTPQLWLPLLWIVLLALPGSMVILLDRTMKTQSYAGFRLLMTALVVLLLAVILTPAYASSLLPTMLFGTSLIGTALFAGKGNRARNIYLVVLLLLWFSFLGNHVWSNYMMH